MNPARIFVEVLRKYLKANPPSSAQQSTLVQKESDYLSATYQSLLEQIGTSYDEIRMARTYRQNPKDQLRLQAIADRLQLQLLTPRPDELDDLFFDVGSAPGAAGALSENALEQLFGLVDTTRDPFSQGGPMGMRTVRSCAGVWMDSVSPPRMATGTSNSPSHKLLVRNTALASFQILY